MKRKSFKKALAGISAAAMLVSAMPMTLIADAYSSISLVNINDDVLDAWASMADSANDQDSRYMYADTLTSAPDIPDNYDQVKFSDYRVVIDGNYDKLGTFDVKRIAKYQYEEVYATQSPTGPEDKTTVLSAKFDFAQAEADLIEALREQGNDRIVAIEFYEDEKNDGDNFGLIKSITMDMPVTTGNGGVNEWSHEVIKFTVVRTADDFTAIATDQAEARHFILANNVSTSEQKQVSFIDDIDINLNGYKLDTDNGLQVLGAKMRIWNGEIDATETNGTTSALGAFGTTSAIELYDGVTISHGATTGKAAITGQGKVVFCGDAVKVKTGAAGVYVFDTTENLTVQAGDYEYKYSTDAGNSYTASSFAAYNAETVKTASCILTQKIHKYNQYGFEVADRGTAATDAVIAASTNYVDVDEREDGTQYGYQPAAASASADEYTVDNLGKLYWAAEKINSVNFNDKANKAANLTVTITKSLDFNDGPADLTWTPIEARGWAGAGTELTITGASTFDTDATPPVTKQNYAVLKNMTVEAANGNGAFISESGIDNTSANQTKIEYLGFENATVSAPNGYASVVVAEAYNTAINHVYVNNSQTTSSVTGNKVGVMAGYLKKSAITNTYTASKSAAFSSLDSTTINTLVQNGSFTAAGLTNFYDSTLYTGAGATAVYLVGATSTQFKNGEVAYRLNGHSIAAVTEPKDWDNGNNASSATVPYSTDVFGQVIGGTTAEYPTFIQGATNGTGKDATNRVYRVIAKKCTGTTENWLATGATFSNTELDPTKGSHTGTKICSTCGAYKISTDNFDPVLIPYLSDTNTSQTYITGGVDKLKNGTSTGSDGWLCPTELTGGTINNQPVTGVTSVVIDLTKADSDKTVDEIIGQIYSTTNPLKGWDILNATSITTTGALEGNSAVKDVRFVVDDSVVCRLDDKAVNDNDNMTDAAKQKGFLVASGFAKDKFEAVSTSGWKDSGMKEAYNTNSFVETSTVVKVDETPNVTEDASKKYSYYVSADQNAHPSDTERVNAANKAFGKVAYPTASFKEGAITYTVIFRGGVTHNELDDKNTNGTYKSATLSAWVDEPVVAVNNKVNGNAGSTHTYVGTYCDCVLATKECKSEAGAITGTGHKIKCTICGQNNTAGDEVPHEFEVLFTIGNVTVKRCMGCGYVTASKETIITAATPVLSRPDFYDDANKVTSKYFRQSYDFSIAAGDGEIVSYGVIYKKNPTKTSAVNEAKVAAKDAYINETPLTLTPDHKVDPGQYFKGGDDTGIELNTEELAKDGVNYTSRKAVKSSLTYRANISMPNVNDAVEIVGYVIYKNYGGTYGIKVTELTKQSFEDVAYAEIENSNVIAEAEHYKKVSNKVEREVFPYTFDIADDCKFINYGVLLTTNTTTPVTADTTLDDADPTINTANGIKSAKKAPSSDAIKSLTYAPSMVMNSGNTGTIRAYAIVEKYDLKWTIYTDVQSWTKP